MANIISKEDIAKIAESVMKGEVNTDADVWVDVDTFIWIVGDEPTVTSGTWMWFGRAQSAVDEIKRQRREQLMFDDEPSFRDDLHRLREITKDCRPDMHEPDEQNVKARVIGDHLDNACGDRIEPDLLEQGAHELVVIIERDGRIERFNLANLIALARRPS